MKPWHGIIPPPPGYDETYGQSSSPINHIPSIINHIETPKDYKIG